MTTAATLTIVWPGRAGSSRKSIKESKLGLFYVPHAFKSESLKDLFLLEIPYITVERSSRLRARSTGFTIVPSPAIGILPAALILNCNSFSTINTHIHLVHIAILLLGIAH